MGILLGRKRVRVAVAAVTALALAGLGAAGAAVAAGNTADDVQPNVIGGNPPTQKYPAGAYVSLKYDAPEHGRENWHTCGAALTFNDTVRTAAHCVTDMPAGLSTQEREELARSYNMDVGTMAIPVKDREYWVRVGSKNKESGGIIARATITWVDPAWNWQTDVNVSNDVAVLKLDRYVDVYTLPLAPRPAQPGDTVYRLGWGVTLPNGSGPLPSRINELRSQIVDPDNCLPGQPYGWTPRDVCVSNVNGTDGACYGDSGGPIAINLDGVWYDAGITSRSTANGCGQAPDSYTSSPEFRTEIYAAARGDVATHSG